MSSESINLLIGGEAGQGLATLSDILCKALVRHGYFIVMSQDYMSRVRGGHNTFTIRVAANKIHAARESYDVVVALNKETLELHRDEMSERSLIIADAGLGIEDEDCLSVPFEELTDKEFSNVAGMGILASILGLEEETVIKTTLDYFGEKAEAVKQKNEQTVKKAFEWALENTDFAFLKLEPPAHPATRLMINGNQAIALGALSAGVKFYSFYPMTPSTSIGVTLASYMNTYPIIVEQAEDELAAMNMVIGASFAGVPAMVGTSGGGLALMSEGVSLAGASETPVVVVVAQRPGPATGFPTRTEQADLNLVLHAGHGEFPRAVLTPATPHQCFSLTRKAFDLAERAQSPVFVLTDQYLADCYQAVEPFDMADLKPVSAGNVLGEIKSGYKRYAYTESGVSPRLLPGKTNHLVVGDSHEHTEDGHITEDQDVRKRMVEKRLKKMDVLKSEVIEPDFSGDNNPSLLLVCWGSTKGVAIEAADLLRGQGERVAVLHFSQVWPLIPKHFMKYLESAGEVIWVEGNATAQFARLVRGETGVEIKRIILRYDGRPITAEYILRKLKKG